MTENSKNTNTTVANNSTTNTTINTKVKEDKKMKENRFLNAMKAESEAKQRAAEEAAAQAEADRLAAIAQAEAEANAKLIEGIEPNKIMQTIVDVKEDKVAPAETYCGTRGNHWIDEVFEYQGHRCFAMGTSQEELEADKEAMKVAISRGDVILQTICQPGVGEVEISGRYVTRMVSIPGAISDCLTIGHTEAERKADEDAARIMAAKLTGIRMISDPPVARDAIDAELNVTDEIEKYNNRYMVIDDKTARDFNGNLAADISDVEGDLPHPVAVELLKGRIEKPAEPEVDAESEEYVLSTGEVFSKEELEDIYYNYYEPAECIDEGLIKDIAGDYGLSITEAKEVVELVEKVFCVEP